MHRVLSAEGAVLLCLHPVGMLLLFLCSIVIPVLAFCALESDLCTHNPTSDTFHDWLQKNKRLKRA